MIEIGDLIKVKNLGWCKVSSIEMDDILFTNVYVIVDMATSNTHKIERHQILDKLDK